MSVLVALISDTHLPKGGRALPESCRERLGAAELIIHAGDIVAASALAELEAIGPPLMAVHGNVDDASLQRVLPSELTVEVAGVSIGVVHDAGPARGRLARLCRAFPAVEAVVFGHSHIPLHEEEAGFQIFNPGSPTERRRQPRPTMGLARVQQGRITFELVALE